MNSDYELYHFGILGMKWGIRRYQNPDGSYTEEGKRRKSKGQDYDPDYWKAHDKKKVEYMSDKELQQRINRINNEKQYKQMQKSSTRRFLEESGQRWLKTVVVGTLIAVSAKYVKDHAPEMISAGRDFVGNLVSAGSGSLPIWFQ